MSGGDARESIGSFPSMSNTAREPEEFLQHQQRQYHVIKPFMGSPPEMGSEDSDLQRITGTSETPPAPPAAKKKRSLPGTPVSLKH
ncbi:hypothetical protein EJB05_16521, partial [Eragrostis curvula]